MSQLIDVTVPDIGDFTQIPIIDLFVKVGDTIAVDDPIATLESDKATMDVPANIAGTVKEILVALGDKVSEGSLLIRVEGHAGTAASAETVTPAAASTPTPVAPSALDPSAPEPTAHKGAPATSAPSASQTKAGGRAHASPSVRRLARELGVDLARVQASNAKGRISKDDVIAFVKAAMQQGSAPVAASGATGEALDLLPWPKVDFAKFGPVERRPKSRIQKISAANLHRNWVMIPHVTNFDEADITDLEAFRQQINGEQGKDGVKVTLLAFLIKAAVQTLTGC